MLPCRVHPREPLVALGDGKECRIVDMKGKRTVAKLTLDNASVVTNVSFHSNLSLVSVSFGMCSSGIWSTTNWERLHTVRCSNAICITSFHPTEYLLGVMQHTQVVLWRPEGPIETIPLVNWVRPYNMRMMNNYILFQNDFTKLVLYNMRTKTFVDTSVTAQSLDIVGVDRDCVAVETYPSEPGVHDQFDTSLVWVDKKGNLQMEVLTLRGRKHGMMHTEFNARLGCWIGVNLEGGVIVEKMTDAEYQWTQGVLQRASCA